MIQSPQEFRDAIYEGRTDTVQGLRLRILKGSQDSDFENLVRPEWVEHRKAVMWLGDDGAENILRAQSLDEILSSIDYTREYIDGILAQGLTFKLLVCQDNPEDFATFDATFDGLENVLETYYPEVHHLITPHLAAIKSIGPNEEVWEQQTGFSASELIQIHTNGPADPNFVATDKIAGQTSIDLGTARRWLYNVLGLNLLWSGSGKMYLTDGSTGPREYFGPAKPVKEIRNHILVDLNDVLQRRGLQSA